MVYLKPTEAVEWAKNTAKRNPTDWRSLPSACACVLDSGFYFTFPLTFAPSLTVILVEVTGGGRIIVDTVYTPLSSSCTYFVFISFLTVRAGVTKWSDSLGEKNLEN